MEPDFADNMGAIVALALTDPIWGKEWVCRVFLVDLFAELVPEFAVMYTSIVTLQVIFTDSLRTKKVHEMFTDA